MPIYHKVEQRSEQWYWMRAGMPTASEFSRILTPGGKPSRQIEAYMHSLLAEYAVGHPITGPETEWMTRGTELEDQAVKAYEFQREIETEPGGFVTTDDGLIGCSPDRLIGEDGILEMKCPKHNTHIGYMLSRALEEEYRPQLQGLLWICEREYVEVVSYCPEMPTVILLVERHGGYIKTLEQHVRAFAEVLGQARLKLNELYGPFPPLVMPERRAPVEPEGDAFGISDADLEAVIREKFPGGEE